MTEKRFEVVDDYTVAYDGDYFDLHKPSNIRSLVTVSNYIVGENEQLKKEIKEYRRYTGMSIDDIKDVVKYLKNIKGDVDD